MFKCIAKEITSGDNSQTRSLEDVYKYICRLEKQFHDELDWLNHTGQKLEEGQIKDYMKKVPEFWIAEANHGGMTQCQTAIDKWRLGVS